MKYPCSNQRILVVNKSKSETNDKSFTLLVVYVLCNCGNNWMEFMIGARIAIRIGIVILVIIICLLYIPSLFLAKQK